MTAFIRRLLQKNDRHSWRTHLGMVREVQAWEERIEREHPILDQTNGDVIAYVANFHRPQNIQPIVRLLLACPSIGRIVVSNNNPASPLRRWLTISSNRIMILDHAEPQSCLMRYVHVRFVPSDMYLILDDDVFPEVTQIEGLCARLREDPSVPHGLYGQRWNGSRFIGGIRGEEGTIDVISRVYAFTAAHVRRFFQNAERIGVSESSERFKRSHFDDVLLSFSGEGQPRIHDLGPLIDCPSQGRKGTATWRTDGFHREREEVFLQLRAAIPLAGA